ncbi:MAG: hypothetical protein U0821_24915 [Chloroflexota bacterium]
MFRRVNGAVALRRALGALILMASLGAGGYLYGLDVQLANRALRAAATQAPAAAGAGDFVLHGTRPGVSVLTVLALTGFVLVLSVVLTWRSDRAFPFMRQPDRHGVWTAARRGRRASAAELWDEPLEWCSDGTVRTRLGRTMGSWSRGSVRLAFPRR